MIIWYYYLITLTNSLNLGSGSIDGYFSLDEVTQIMQNYTNLYPKLTMQSIGTTFYNKTIPVIILPNPSSPKILIIGGHHARELISITQVLYLLDFILTDPSSALSSTREIWFIPVLNVDGFDKICEYYAEEKAILEIRKNIRPTGCELNGEGIDLNRNYGYKWGYDSTGSSGYECSEDYRGPHSFSEKETQSIKVLLEEHQFDAVISYHSYGDLYIRPMGYTNTPLKYLPESHQSVYNSLQKILPTSFRFGSSIDLLKYPVNGSFMDYLYSLNIFSIEIEIGPENFNSFHPDISEVSGILNTHLNPFLLLAEQTAPLLAAETTSKGRTVTINIKNKGIARSRPTQVVCKFESVHSVSFKSAHEYTYENNTLYVNLPSIKSEEINPISVLLNTQFTRINASVSFSPLFPSYANWSGTVYINENQSRITVWAIVSIALAIAAIIVTGLVLYKCLTPKKLPISFVEFKDFHVASEP